MQITLINIGKTDNKNLEYLIGDYTKRLGYFTNFRVEDINQPKNFKKMKPNELKKAEAELVLKKLKNDGVVILLDEKGRQYKSVEFANKISKLMNTGYKNIYFVIGGAFGFAKDLYDRADELLSLSSMTTTHQLIRLFFTEQLYRAFTIIKGHPYHND